MLHPRIHGGLLGDWSDREQREELERQGVKRIDMVVVELPDLLQAGESGPGLQDRFEVGGAAVLRSAARNPEWVTAICDLSDFPAVTRDMDSRSGRVGDEIRKRLAIKALLKRDDIDGVVILGAVIEGDTEHDDVIISHASRKAIDLAVELEKPVALGITGPGMSRLQAEARIERAKAAVESVVKQIKRLKEI